MVFLSNERRTIKLRVVGRCVLIDSQNISLRRSACIEKLKGKHILYYDIYSTQAYGDKTVVGRHQVTKRGISDVCFTCYYQE